MVDPWAKGRKGIDILADILRYTDSATTQNIIRNLARTEPRIAAELKRRIFTFEDLEFCDPRGIQRLLKLVSLRDLAIALKGAPEGVLTHIAHQMSKRAIEDLRDEIALLGPLPRSEIEIARNRILDHARKLVERNELFFIRSDDKWIP